MLPLRLLLMGLQVAAPSQFRGLSPPLEKKNLASPLLKYHDDAYKVSEPIKNKRRFGFSTCKVQVVLVA